MVELFKALAEFQDEVPVIHEETKGYNYTYANLNSVFKTIKPLLKVKGLGFTQFLNGDSLDTYLFHIKTGQKIESSILIPKGVALKGQNEFQTLGSGITYLRRYSLACLLGLITDKDIDACGDTDVEPKLNRCKTLDELKEVYGFLSKSDQSKYATLKNKLKINLK